MWIHFQKFSHDFTILFIALNSHIWIHIWFHDHEFTSMNSEVNSYIWIMTYEFTIFFIIMNSYLNSYQFISEFILWIHIRFHDHEFICDISWPMNSYMNSCIWRISWNHTWKHVYQGSRWFHSFHIEESCPRVDIPPAQSRQAGAFPLHEDCTSLPSCCAASTRPGHSLWVAQRLFVY